MKNSLHYHVDHVLWTIRSTFVNVQKLFFQCIYSFIPAANVVMGRLCFTHVRLSTRGGVSQNMHLSRWCVSQHVTWAGRSVSQHALRVGWMGEGVWTGFLRTGGILHGMGCKQGVYTTRDGHRSGAVRILLKCKLSLSICMVNTFCRNS